MTTKELDRRKMVSCMEYIARQINDEDIFDLWRMAGVAEGDIHYGDLDPAAVDEFYIKDENFKDIMNVFVRAMVCVQKYEAGLYCGGVLS